MTFSDQPLLVCYANINGLTLRHIAFCVVSAYRSDIPRFTSVNTDYSTLNVPLSCLPHPRPIHLPHCPPIQCPLRNLVRYSPCRFRVWRIQHRIIPANISARLTIAPIMTRLTWHLQPKPPSGSLHCPLCRYLSVSPPSCSSH